MRAFHLTRLAAITLASLHVLPPFSNSSLTVLLHDPLGRPTDRDPWGFHSRACLSIASLGFLKQCPIHLHLRLLICNSINSSFASLCRFLLLIITGQWMFKILRRHLFMNVCSLLLITLFDNHVSEPYRRTALTLLLNILTLVFRDIAYTYFSIQNITAQILHSFF